MRTEKSGAFGLLMPEFLCLSDSSWSIGWLSGSLVAWQVDWSVDRNFNILIWGGAIKNVSAFIMYECAVQSTPQHTHSTAVHCDDLRLVKAVSRAVPAYLPKDNVIKFYARANLFVKCSPYLVLLLGNHNRSLECKSDLCISLFRCLNHCVARLS
jgi:hypothetical protein